MSSPAAATPTPPPPEHHTHHALPPPATGPVALITAALGTVLLLTSGRYGYFGDELYFLAAGDHLSWGYADQTPAVPLIARAMQTLTPDSLVALRLPALLATTGCVVLAAVLTRELGGGRRAQTLTVSACAVSIHFLGSGHLLVTWSFDQLLWTVLLWLLARWVRLRARGEADDRLLLWAGVATAAALQVKFLIPVLWMVLIPAVLLSGPRALLTRPLLWAGGAIAVLATAPTLVWQAVHGWPQWAMTKTVATETGSVWSFLVFAARQLGPVGTVLGCFGLWRLLREPHLRCYRFLGWTALGVLAVFLLAGGRPYYIAGLYPLLFAAGSVGLQHCRVLSGSRRWWGVALPAYGLSAWMALGALPILPVSSIRPTEVISRASIGWTALTARMAEAYHALPPAQRRDTAVLTHDYWSAAAIHHFGPEHGIAEVYSPSRGFWYFARPPETTRQVLYLGADRALLRRYFTTVRRVGTVHTDLAARTHYEGMPIWLATAPRQPWPALWPRLHHMSLWG